MMKMPQSDVDAYELGGGLDQVTPAIKIPPGRALDSQNYEPAPGGGYGRINGYERFDGRASPSDASYWLMPVVVTGTIAVGNTVTGATSSATGIVLGMPTGFLVLGRVAGTFTDMENLLVAAVVQGQTAGTTLIDGAESPSDHADYELLSADDQRALIQAVPGSGPVRGVFCLADIWYAFRNNSGGTAKVLYKQTAGGWVSVPMAVELPFSSTMGGVTPITAGQTIGNAAAPTKTASVVAVLTRKGVWGTDAVGTLIITPLVGSFVNTDPIYVGATQKAVATAGAATVTLLPGGRGEYFEYNFVGTAAAMKMYGVDGVNPAFEFDGTTYIPIRTGMTPDTPAHVIGYRDYLFLSFNASVQRSSVNNPYSWTVVLGAGELQTSYPVAGFLPQGGDNAGSSLAIFTARRTFVLYGNSDSDFKLVSSAFDLGFSPFTSQQVGNDAFGLTARGIQRMKATLDYGDFQYAAVSELLQPLLETLRGKEIASTTLKAKNQYRLYFDDNSALVVGLTGGKPVGTLVLNYGLPVRCIYTATLSTGEEVTMFGSDDGFVYQESTGTSFDGDPIEAWMRLPFNNLKSPWVLKRFRRAMFDVAIDSFSVVNVSYDLGYGNPDVQPVEALPDKTLIGGGGYWDQFTWDQFTWDAQLVSDPSMPLDGTEKNISLLFYSNRAQDGAHTLQGITIVSTKQRLARS